MKLFGFEISRQNGLVPLPSIAQPIKDDGAINVQAMPQFGDALTDIATLARSERDMITRYREISLHPEMQMAIDDIVNEMLLIDHNQPLIKINLEKIAIDDKLKATIQEEFDTILYLLDFNKNAFELLRRWYIDGRMYFHPIVDENNPKKGILELRYLDPRKIKLIREIQDAVDEHGRPIKVVVQEYFIYDDNINAQPSAVPYYTDVSTQPVRIAKDSVVFSTSGITDEHGRMILSFLHSSIKPLNQLRMIEDSCLSATVKISTPNGRISIAEIEDGDEVFYFDTNTRQYGLTKVNKKWSNGVRDVVKIKTYHKTITCTPDHKFLTVYIHQNNKKKFTWKRADELCPGKDQFVNQNPIMSGVPVPIPDVITKGGTKILNPSRFDRKTIFTREMETETGYSFAKITAFLNGYGHLPTADATKILEKLNEERNVQFDTENVAINSRSQKIVHEFVDENIARLYGFLLGDGYVTDTQISFAEGVNEERNQYYADLIEKFCGNRPKRQNTKSRKYTAYVSYTVYGAKTLKALGYEGTARTKRFPAWAFTASPEIKMAMIEGFLDADGYKLNQGNCTSYKISLCQRGLLEDIKEIWSSLGLNSGHINEYTRKMSKSTLKGFDKNKPYTSYTINISKSPLPKFETVLSIEPAGQEEVFDLEVEHEEHNFIANGVVAHNCVIYRLSRASERRIFYVNVGNMPGHKAEQHLYNLMTRHKNRLVYNTVDGNLRDDRRMISMIDDYWFPVYGPDDKATRVDTLPAAQNLGEMEDIKYFRDRLNKSLNIPVSRTDPNTPYVLGRASEISRDEIKFQKFIERIRRKFAIIFDSALEKQFALKGIMSPEEWKMISQNIEYDFNKDGFFMELKDLGIMQERATLLEGLQPFVGLYFSEHEIKKKVLQQTDDEIARINQENMIEAEEKIQQEAMKQQLMLKLGILPPAEQA